MSLNNETNIHLIRAYMGSGSISHVFIYFLYSGLAKLQILEEEYRRPCQDYIV